VGRKNIPELADRRSGGPFGQRPCGLDVGAAATLSVRPEVARVMSIEEESRRIVVR